MSTILDVIAFGAIAIVLVLVFAAAYIAVRRVNR